MIELIKLGSTKKGVDKDKDGENVPKLEYVDLINELIKINSL